MNLIITQALATGLPVITTYHSGLPEQVMDGVNGFLAAEGNPRDLASKIILYLDQPERWRHFSQAGRDWVKKHYDSSHRLAQQLDYYQQILGNNHHRPS